MPFQPIAYSTLYRDFALHCFTIHSIRTHSFFLHFENYSEIQRYPIVFSGIISANNCYRNFRFLIYKINYMCSVIQCQSVGRHDFFIRSEQMRFGLHVRML